MQVGFIPVFFAPVFLTMRDIHQIDEIESEEDIESHAKVNITIELQAFEKKHRTKRISAAAA